MRKWLNNGTGWVWLTASMLGISLFSVLMVLLIIGWNGLYYFWPAPLYEWQGNNENSHLIGQLQQKNINKWSQSEEDTFWTIKVANKELYQYDHISVAQSQLHHVTTPDELAIISRINNGDFFGRIEAIIHNDIVIPVQSLQQVDLFMEQGYVKQAQIEQLIDSQIADKNSPMSHDNSSAFEHEQGLENSITMIEMKVDQLRAELTTTYLQVKEMEGRVVNIPLSQIESVWFPNQMSVGDKLQHWFVAVWHFLTENPREATSSGGVFPAIFGTIFLVIVMSVVVMPLGVIGAIYLHEYARNSTITRLIRVAVINLAGVPSIVYGVFGLGFFVYSLGGSIDALFYSEQLPTPTFGTPGLLWAALTLALLTLPVVIVATEEGLSRIPVSLRESSYALGATKWETLWYLVLPIARPALLTGLVLAVARAAGEVAPLMLVGAVKLAPTLPLDAEFPFLHLERKFMHLGFHIYDVGFQAANLESARPIVYATSLLLVTVVIGLNLTAIRIRNTLNKRYNAMSRD